MENAQNVQGLTGKQENAKRGSRSYSLGREAHTDMRDEHEVPIGCRRGERGAPLKLVLLRGGARS